MGEDVERTGVHPRADRTRYREKVRRCLDVFARMLREARFDTDDPMTGLEVELNLVDEQGDPALKNAEALEAIADPAFQTELGQFNLEINVPPARLARRRPQRRSRTPCAAASTTPRPRPTEVGAHMVMIGILPTLAAGHLARPDRSAPTRATSCSATRSWPPGARTSRSTSPAPERLITTADSIMPEAACTSTQLHVQVSPEQFAAYWNASQAIAAVQLAVGANSPYLLGQGAVARDPDPAVRAGHRHPQRGAEGAGRASAGVVRRALDQLDLRPVRGERPLLPGAAADHRRRGPGRGARGRAARRRSRSCGCTTARSTAGTGRSTTSSTACRTCAWRTACSPAGRRSPT